MGAADMKNFYLLMLTVLMFTFLSCKGDKLPKNKVDIDQLNYDNSNNYKFIFKDTMEEEKRKKSKYKKKNDL
jgi:hypothetical protein